MNFSNIVYLISLAFFYFSVILFLKRTEKRISHLYSLIDVLSIGAFPMIKIIFNKMRTFDSFKDQNITKLIRETYLSFLNEIRENLVKKKKDIEDPIELSMFNKNLNEIENVINLLSTIDENSSEEYIKQVMTDIEATFFKLS